MCAQCAHASAAESFRLSHPVAVVASLHKGGAHVGYIPAGLVATQARDAKLRDIKSRLSKAIDAENYEEAARLRDELEEVSPEISENPVAESEL